MTNEDPMALWEKAMLRTMQYETPISIHIFKKDGDIQHVKVYHHHRR